MNLDIDRDVILDIIDPERTNNKYVSLSKDKLLNELETFIEKNSRNKMDELVEINSRDLSKHLNNTVKSPDVVRAPDPVRRMRLIDDDLMVVNDYKPIVDERKKKEEEKKKKEEEKKKKEHMEKERKRINQQKKGNETEQAEKDKIYRKMKEMEKNMELLKKQNEQLMQKISSNMQVNTTPAMSAVKSTVKSSPQSKNIFMDDTPVVKSAPRTTLKTDSIVEKIDDANTNSSNDMKDFVSEKLEDVTKSVNEYYDDESIPEPVKNIVSNISQDPSVKENNDVEYDFSNTYSDKITLLRDDIELPKGLKMEDISNIYNYLKGGDWKAARTYISKMDDMNHVQWIYMLSSIDGKYRLRAEMAKCSSICVSIFESIFDNGILQPTQKGWSFSLNIEHRS